ncbi:MAG TPA: response regulator [Gaiellaceae bacterium]|nr:response regulator [Gaiellaceae bacterium]
MEASSAVNGPAHTPGPRPRVLIVDDDPAIRLVCATSLGLDGFEVIEAANGQEALDFALRGAADVMLLDISMPILDGFGVAAALRADDRTRELPFVFLTGELDPHIAERGHAAGAAGFFAKPFDPAAVAAALRVLVERLPSAARSAPLGGHAF